MADHPGRSGPTDHSRTATCMTSQTRVWLLRAASWSDSLMHNPNLDIENSLEFRVRLRHELQRNFICGYSLELISFHQTSILVNGDGFHVKRQ
jgi:hypothetical protein